MANEDNTTSNNLWRTVVLPIFVAWRIWYANRLPIMDCDEVYNYWEPLHFAIFGTGLQTWEYAQHFALRTYAYLVPLLLLSKSILLPLLHYIPVSWTSILALHNVIEQQPNNNDGVSDTVYNRLALMVLIRAILAATMAWSEVSFLEALASCDSHIKSAGGKNSNQNMAIVVGFLLITSTGMSHAAGALLPSSTLTMMWLLAAKYYVQRKSIYFVVIAILSTLAIGWPFGVLLFVPLGGALLIIHYQRSGFKGVLWLLSCSLGIALLVQGIVLYIDYTYYNRWVSPVLNILLYNTHAKGDELYGVEPASYYVKNLLLNFNYVAVFGFAVGPVMVWKILRKRSAIDGDGHNQLHLNLFVLTLPMYAWLGVLFPRPHKEERFLFPAYPIICLGAAIVGSAFVDTVVTIWNRFTTSTRPSSTASKAASGDRSVSLYLQLALWVPAALIGVSRTTALSKYYTAPFHVYAQFQHEMPLLSRKAVDATSNPESEEKEAPTVASSTTTICTCGEWYRFPSSFYLPTSRETIVSFKFVSPSSSYFEGQLPHAFLPQGSGIGETYTAFNDRNLPEFDDRYVPIDECDYLVDAIWGNPVIPYNEIEDNPSCRDNDSQWLPVIKSPFLDAERTSALHRILYLPVLHNQADIHGGVEYADYVLFRRIQERPEDGNTHSPREGQN